MKTRIQEIAQYISPYTRIADIGCDHGFLILEAFKNGATFAQAIDNKKGPLSSAIQNLESVKDKVVFSLSDGLSMLDPSIEVVIISGMGGMLIVAILTAQFDKLKNVKRLIIQANRNIDKVRLFGSKNGYLIVSEKIIYEEGIYYEIIVFEKGYSSYTLEELHFGPHLLKEKGQIFLNKWLEQLNRFENIGSNNTNKKVEIIKKALNIKEEK
jgi:tRNA (adenine22-N1)-methyltransferase